MTDHEIIASIHRRMDDQDKMLREIRDKVISQESMKPTLDELVTLWKGSKIVFPILAAAIAFLGAAWAWGVDHLK